jgi:aldehyde dehydrogenase (NAD+)
MSEAKHNYSEAAIRAVFELQQKHQWEVARSGVRERIARLRRLHDAVIRYRDEIEAAAHADFGKPGIETVLSEIGPVTTEIRHAIRHLRSWMKPKRVSTPMFLTGTWSKILYEPKGVCLIISPWNFPFNLTFVPLVSAIAAGNCVILKPSEFTPHSSALMRKIVAEFFPPEEVALFEGDVEVSQELLKLPFNHIFFTGSPAVGKIVMRAAADNLTSVTLELGGKSPVFVDENTDIDHAAAKVAWLKCMNAGQICIAPDYVLVHERVHDVFVQALVKKIHAFYGETEEARRQSPDYCRLVSQKHQARVASLFRDAVERGAKVHTGGGEDISERFLDPAVITDVPDGAAIWEEEIFGPVLPVRPYKTLDEALAFVNARPRPLAIYIFSNDKRYTDKIHSGTRAGGGTVNDCGIHFYQPNMPFGGVNNSGIGGCHGEAGFLEFSNQRGVTWQNRIFPHTNMILPPYGSKISRLLGEAVVKWL